MLHRASQQITLNKVNSIKASNLIWQMKIIEKTPKRIVWNLDNRHSLRVIITRRLCKPSETFYLRPICNLKTVCYYVSF